MSNKDYPYPDDEFDVAGASRVPKGVHREPVPRWKQWVPYLLVLILVPLLTIVVVQFFATSPQTGETPGAQPTETVSPTEEGEDPSEEGDPSEGDTEEPEEAIELDQGVKVVVYNGARVSGLAGRVTGFLEGNGWTNTAADNHEGDTPTTTTVFYGSEDVEAEAREIADKLGIAEVVEDATEAPEGIAVVLRPGFTEPTS